MYLISYQHITFFPITALIKIGENNCLGWENRTHCEVSVSTIFVRREK